MMSVLEYAQDVNKTVREILEYCKELEIDVVTIMPKGDTEEFLGDIDLPELATTFHCHTLYYDDDQFKKGEFEFSGSFCKK